MLPIAAHVRFGPDGLPREVSDYRWNIEALVNLLVEKLPTESRLEFSRVARLRHYQERIARRIVYLTSAATGAVGAAPIPVADMPLLTMMQTFMVLTIAYISGRLFSLESARELLAAAGVNVGAGYVLREVARGLVKLVPMVGWAVAGGVASAGTQAIGEAAIAYFIEGATLFSPGKKAA